MSRIGKKILSVFVETADDKKEKDPNPDSTSDGAKGPYSMSAAPGTTPTAITGPAGNPRFIEYFDKLFGEANIPGPDYYEFSKMTGAMQAVPDEQARFYAAFAGLQVQGLDKETLLSTAGEYLRILSADAAHFQATVDSALREKVLRRTTETEEKGQRIRRLSQEILELQGQITALQAEIRENKEKIEASSGEYAVESERRKARIEEDIEKIRHFIH